MPPRAPKIVGPSPGGLWRVARTPDPLGWQTSKEPAYVEASRARKGTDWFIAREELGADGQDPDRIKTLAALMRRSKAQTPSLAHHELADPDYGPGFHHPLTPSRSRLPGLARAIHRLATPDQTPDRSL